MFVNPQDQREGNRRQMKTRASIDSLLREAAMRKSRRSKHFGAVGKGPRSSNPFRGASGMRQLAMGNRQGGHAEFMRLPGQALQHSPHFAQPPHISDPEEAEDLPEPRGSAIPGAPLYVPPVPGDDEEGWFQGGVDAGGQPYDDGPLSFGSGPSIGGLIPIGPGIWLDPETGLLHGAGQG